MPKSPVRELITLFVCAGFAVACSVEIPEGRIHCERERDGDCPTHWYCRADMRCYRSPGPLRDASADAAADSGNPDGGDEPENTGGSSGSGGASGHGGAGGKAGSNDSGSGGSAAGSGGAPALPNGFRVIAAAPSDTIDDLYATLQVSFSASVAAPSVTASSFVVMRNGQQLAGKLEVSGSNANFKPDLPWALAGKYTMQLSADIKDADDHALQPYQHDLSVREGAWSHEKRSDISGGGYPLLAVAKDGWALLAWTSATMTMYDDVLASLFTPPSTWASARTVVSGSSVGLTAVAINTKHHGALTWPSISNDVHLNSLTTGPDWDMSVYLSTTAYNPFLLLDRSDALYAICDTPTKGSASTLVGHHFNLGASSPASIDVGGTAAGNTYGQVAIVDGAPRAVWQHNEGGSSNGQIMTGGFDTSSGTALSANGVNATEPKLVSNDPQSSAVAVWGQVDATWTNVWAARLPAGGTWSSPLRISDNTSSTKQPAIAMDDRGRTLAVWAQGGAVMSAVFTPGSDWSASAPITAAGVTSAAAPAIAIEPGGNAIAAWTQDGPMMSLNEVWVARYRADDGWQSGDRVRVSDMEAGTNEAVSLGIDDSGRAFVAWYQSNQIWIARFE